jgi:hypothetical protein
VLLPGDFRHPNTRGLGDFPVHFTGKSPSLNALPLAHISHRRFVS